MDKEENKDQKQIEIQLEKNSKFNIQQHKIYLAQDKYESKLIINKKKNIIQAMSKVPDLSYMY